MNTLPPVVADKLLAAIARAGKLVRGHRHAQVTTSIGITTTRPGEESTTEDLIVEADIAMYDAKGEGKNRSSIYDRDQQGRERIVAREDWMMRLREAVEEELLVLVAQPITPICTNGVPRFELLLRLPDGDGDLIAPGTFLSNAERFDLIQPTDRWVMSKPSNSSTNTINKKQPSRSRSTSRPRPSTRKTSLSTSANSWSATQSLTAASSSS